MKLTKTKPILLFITIFVFITFHWIFADVIIISELNSKGGKKIVTRYIKENKIRVDTRGKKEKKTTIFRADKDVYWEINHTDKTYGEITKDDIRRIRQNFDNVDKKLKSYPPDKSREMERKKTRKINSSLIVKYKKVKSGVKVKHWTCDEYLGYVGSTKRYGLWTTPFGSLKLNVNDFKIMIKNAQFFSEMGAPLYTDMFPSDIIPEKMKTADNYSGLPMKLLLYKNGAVITSMEVTEIKNGGISPTLFDVPAGYKKKKSGKRKGSM